MNIILLENLMRILRILLVITTFYSKILLLIPEVNTAYVKNKVSYLGISH
jgi:hypothetical protein